ncbi:hypothetical protein CH64_1179 [Yersinia rohdei]|uniref:Uncharacterized protein n=1 Tax=Yersinia rohdei TaxID=29485 RepID=A0A0U1HVA7_YERRO|nr:hypothetical protein [Yersinia rohdei]AJJ11073.1 hypothetical protein CH64_1179 [Yersinia rohdei]CQI93453.1 Uncharacterised protein [Yersinia rohdei]CQJ45506.1 Uncharacterised protein [Yersinia rohdei]
MNNKKSQIEKLLFVITLIFDIGTNLYLLRGAKEQISSALALYEINILNSGPLATGQRARVPNRNGPFKSR